MPKAAPAPIERQGYDTFGCIVPHLDTEIYINSLKASISTIYMNASKQLSDVASHIKMSYTTEDIASALKAARESKGLSQRELSTKAGVPQGHISKIEHGAVDLRLSSLIALARVLDLELTLVPRKTVPAVQSIVRSSEPPASRISGDARLAFKELKRLQETLAGLPKINWESTELAQFQRQIRELQHFQLSRSDLEAIRSVHQAFKEYMNTHNLDEIRESLSRLKSLRNARVHDVLHGPQKEAARPAYSLNEDDRG